MKRVLSFLLVLCMVAAMLPVSAHAETPEPISEATEYLSGQDEIVRTVRQGLVNREETITVDFVTDTWDENCGTAFMESALAHTGIPTEGDYLRWHLAGYETELAGYAAEDLFYITVTYRVSYYTTAVQEAEVTEQVAALLSELNPSGSDYERIKCVYDWICGNIVYDHANLENEAYTLKYSAYAALVDKTAVCQGYALLLYRLALEMGIDCRIITGVSHDEAHAWNIVKLDDLYYNLDSTWDAELDVYQYFLKCESNFEDHTRNDSYTSEEFAAYYPMSDTDYVSGYEIYREGDFEYHLFEDAATLVKYHGLDADVTIPGTVYGLPVTAIGNSAFYANDTVVSVTFPASVQVIEDGTLDFRFELGYYGSGAFRECGSLSEVIIPEDSQLRYIGEWSFNDSALSSITLPSAIRELKLSCFEGTKLTELILPEGLEYFGQNAVSRTRITRLDIPSTCIWFSSYCNLDQLEYISVAENNPNYRSFEGVLYAYDTPYFPNSWGLWLYPVSKPEATYSVPEYCEYIFGDSLAGVDAAPKYLQKIFIGNSIGATGDFSEETISRLRCEIIAGESNPKYVSYNGMLFTRDMKTLLQVPSSVSGTVVIPNGVEKVEEYAAEWGAYSEIVIPDTVTYIGSSAFWYTSTLEHIYIPDSVTYLGSAALMECCGLKTCRLSAGLSSLESMTLQSCTELQYLVIPGGVVSIGFQAMAICPNLRYVYIPSTVKTIAASAFQTYNTHTHIFYGGSEECWTLIDIEDIEQPLLHSAQFHFETVIDIDDAPLDIEKPDHTFEAVVTPPTDTEDGYTTYICPCGDCYVDDYVSAGTPGDVNEDGEIDILDANLVVAWYNEVRELEDEQLLAADVNGDGEVDIMDANMIVAYYNEVIDTFPAQK